MAWACINGMVKHHYHTSLSRFPHALMVLLQTIDRRQILPEVR